MTERPARWPHLSRGARAVLLLALGWVAFGLADGLLRLRLPTDGWAITHDYGAACGDCPLLLRDLLGRNPDLRAGDIVVGLEGRPLSWSVAAATVSPQLWRAGHRVTYSVKRKGQLRRVAVTLGRWDARAVGLLRDPGVLSGLALLGLGLFVFFRRPEDMTARVLLLIATFSFVNVVNPPGGLPEASRAGAGLAPALIHNLGVPLLYFPLILLLTLVFPRPKGPYRRSPRLTMAALFGGPALLLALALLLSVPDASVGWAMGGTLILLSALSIGHTLFTVRDPQGRTQVRWLLGGFLLWGLSLVPVFLAFFKLIPGVGPGSPLQVLTDFVGVLAVPLGLAVAVLRYRALDIDLILNRALVWGTLTAFVVGVYALLVGYFGSLWQGQPLWVSLLAAGVVALAFQPLRERTQRGVNRLIYGLRDEPYAALTGLGRRLEGTLPPAEVLPTIVQTVAQTLRLPYAALRLAQLDAPLAVYGQSGPVTERFVLTAQGERVGELELSPREGDGGRFTRTERRLLEDFARHIASAARAVQLGQELQRSREALVLAREEERKRLRRDLHDGLGPTLASQTMRLEAAIELVEHDPAAAQALLRDLQAQTQGTIAEIRRLVQGLRPPSLDEHGLAGALRALGSLHGSPRLQVEVEVAPLPLPPLPAALEVAAYRIVAEALTNVARHAQAQHCRIRLELRGGLRLSIEDDGRGLAPGFTAGVGLRSMAERAAELGGTLDLRARAQGSCLTAHIPLPEA